MAFTKIVGAGIHTLSNVHTHNINSSGIITATQFVGIFTGTDGNFSGNLDVGGNVSIGGSLTVNGDFTTLNTTLREVEILNVDANSSESAGIITQRGSGDILNLFDTNTEVFTVKDGGNVGIGSQSPATLLNLMSNNPLIRLTDSDNGGYSAIGGEGGNLYLYTNSSSRDFIFRGSNEVARLTGDGYFGIGVNATNPGHNIVSHIGSNTAYNGNVINNTALAIGNVNSTANTNSVGIYMYSDGNGRGVVGLNCLSNSTGSSADFTIQTRHSGSLFERLRITSNGRIGVNNNNPDSNFRVDCAGSVRIGTGSYGSRLQFSRSGLGDELVIGVDGYVIPQRMKQLFNHQSILLDL